MLMISIIIIGLLAVALLVMSLLTYKEKKKNCTSDKTLQSYTSSLVALSGLLIIGIGIILAYMSKRKGGASFSF